MKKLLLTALFAFALSPLARAEEPSFDKTRWIAFIERIAKEGTQTEVGELAFLGFTKLTPADESVSHTAEYISVVGRLQIDLDTLKRNDFVPFEVSSVSEVWTKLDNGQWDIYQEIREARMNGKLFKVLRSHIVKEANKISVVKYERLPVGDVNSAEEQAGWIKKLGEWY